MPDSNRLACLAIDLRLQSTAPVDRAHEVEAFGELPMSLSMTGQESTVPVTIRAYTDADWLAVCTVHDRARPVELEGSCDPRAFVPLADDQEDRESFQCSHKFVATIDVRIVGFSGIDGTCLSWLYVDPPYWGRGIGRQLLRHAVDMIGPQAWTVVLAGNARAQRLYGTEGFCIVRTSEGSNSGYPCTSFRLALSPSAAGASADQASSAPELLIPLEHPRL